MHIQDRVNDHKLVTSFAKQLILPEKTHTLYHAIIWFHTNILIACILISAIYYAIYYVQIVTTACDSNRFLES